MITACSIKDASLREPGGSLIIFDVARDKIHICFYWGKIVIDWGELVKPLLLPVQTLAECLRVNHLWRILIARKRGTLSNKKLFVFDSVFLADKNKNGD